MLLVDIWDEPGRQEVSLVRHSSSSPAVSISAATTSAYPPPVERPFLGLLDPHQLQAYYMMNGDTNTAANLAQLVPQPSHQLGISYRGQSQVPIQVPIMPPVMPSSQGMFTKNLIGSLSANATKLLDPEGKPGYWFILQDLSVRTEGMFRSVWTITISF